MSVLIRSAHKATALDLGMIFSVGFTAEKADVMSHLRAAGFAAMREEEFHPMLNELCDPYLGPSSPSRRRLPWASRFRKTEV